MIEYRRSVKEGLGFLRKPVRWLPLFILDSVFFLVIAFVFASSIVDFLTILSGTGSFSSMPLEIITGVTGAAVSFVIWVALRLFVLASVVHQTFHEKEFAKSWAVARQRYLSLAGALFVATAINMLITAVPFVGIVFSILVSWAFFFIMQDVISTNKDSFLALNNTMKMFKRKPLSVIASWLAVALVATVITLLFALPLIALLFSTLSGKLMTGATDPSQIVAGVLASLQSSPVLFTGAVLLFVFGASLATVCALKMQTELYQQMKKNLKPAVFRLFS